MSHRTSHRNRPAAGLPVPNTARAGWHPHPIRAWRRRYRAGSTGHIMRALTCGERADRRRYPPEGYSFRVVGIRAAVTMNARISAS